MSYGVPVIATRRGGIVDVVADGETGLLVEDDPAALADGIATLLEDPARGRALGRAGHARVRERFGWNSIVDRLEAVYRAEPGRQ
jgi:starch synthase